MKQYPGIHFWSNDASNFCDISSSMCVTESHTHKRTLCNKNQIFLKRFKKYKSVQKQYFFPRALKKVKKKIPKLCIFSDAKNISN